jgi:hypothetical protein
MQPAALPSYLSFPWEEADEMLTLLVSRAAKLINCSPGSSGEQEFDQLVSAIQAYDAKRWPAPRRRKCDA